MARESRKEAPRDDADAIDLGAAERFLKALDPDAEEFCFQTFDDNPDRELKNKNLSWSRSGTMVRFQEWLIQANGRGAGVFVTVNRTDGIGRTKRNITAVRALLLDLDGEPLDPVNDCALKPHIITETSPGNFHALWRVEGMPLEKFEDVQRGLAKRFGGDPAVATLERCTRLPGFLHLKDIENPFRVRIVAVNEDPAYSAEAIEAEFPPEKKAHRPPKSIADRIILPAGVPLVAADKFYEMRYLRDGVRALHFYRGEFFEWQGTHYQRRDIEAIRHSLYGFLVDCFVIKDGQSEPYNPRASKVSEVLDALRAGTFQDERLELPRWIGAHFKDYPRDGWLACRNGLMDLADRELYEHTPAYFNVVGLPYDYDPDAPPPKRWLRFLAELWPDDPECRELLAEIFGYALTADNSQQKIFLLVGPTRSGKGTIGNVLTALLGADNVVNPTLASLTGEFGLMPWINRRLALISDARLGSRNISTVTERLLSISGGDTLTVNRKYLPPWNGKLGTRIVILTNELPRFLDASRALAGRFVILALSKSFYGKEDPNLGNKLIAELPGILNWSLEGLDRRRQRGRFVMPKSSQEAVRIITDLASPVSAFVRDWCVLGERAQIPRRELFAAYSKWCEQEGYRVGSAESFGRNLKAAHPQIRTDGKMKGQHAYIGIDLTDKARDELEDGPEPGWRG
jgi:putative DNA primase/helicase